ncbi:MAG: hypothetical protein HY816_17720 [Candidatus Wallbacteria bacterium]|nr:hypothetical protein [Candidatus Wallbacteria bacterium]
MNSPYEMGRDMLITWEKSMGEMLERLSRSEGFLKHMSDAFGRSLDFKKQIDQQLQASLEALNIPTKADMQRILSYLLRIEKKLLDLEDQLQAASQPKSEATPVARPAAARPAARKKPSVRASAHKKPAAPPASRKPSAPAKSKRRK